VPDKDADARRFALLTGLLPITAAWDYDDARRRFYEEVADGGAQFLPRIPCRQVSDYSHREAVRLQSRRR